MTASPNIPTVILVHGGFADASFWAPVIKDLQAHNRPVLAPPNPLRGLAYDAEYIASYVNQVDGPVLLVGHSYGGAVISVAGASTPNAVGLVYVARTPTGLTAQPRRPSRLLGDGLGPIRSLCSRPRATDTRRHSWTPDCPSIGWAVSRLPRRRTSSRCRRGSSREPPAIGFCARRLAIRWRSSSPR
jgi:pimeloyl-ACP methyl ester carboxylesterase